MWTIGEVIEHTFRAFGKSWVALVVGYFVSMLIAFSPMALWGAVSILPLVLKGESVQPILSEAMVGSGLLAFTGTALLMILFTPGQTRIALAAARGQSPRISWAFDFRRAGTLFASALLMSLAVLGGTLLLIVPGIIVALALQLYAFFVVDTELGAMDALRASWHATRGHRAHLFGFMCLVVLAEMIAKLVVNASVWLAPLQLALALVSAPLWLVALATIYDRVRPAPPTTELLAA